MGVRSAGEAGGFVSVVVAWLWFDDGTGELEVDLCVLASS